jgi:hypothetical protein
MSVLFTQLRISVASFVFCLSIGIAYPHPHVHVIGNNQQQEVIEMVNFYADLLDLGPQISIIVSYDSDLPKGIHGYTMFKAYDGENAVMQVYIKISTEQNANAQRLTLAHEMVHVKQFVKGELVHYGHEKYSWNGIVYTHIHLIPYLRRQWEREAVREQYVLFKQFRRKKMQQNDSPQLTLSAEE